MNQMAKMARTNFFRTLEINQRLLASLGTYTNMAESWQEQKACSIFIPNSLLPSSVVALKNSSLYS